MRSQQVVWSGQVDLSGHATAAGASRGLRVPSPSTRRVGIQVKARLESALRHMPSTLSQIDPAGQQCKPSEQQTPCTTQHMLSTLSQIDQAVQAVQAVETLHQTTHAVYAVTDRQSRAAVQAFRAADTLHHATTATGSDNVSIGSALASFREELGEG